jgi:hypothetical protein
MSKAEETKERLSLRQPPQLQQNTAETMEKAMDDTLDGRAHPRSVRLFLHSPFPPCS